MAFKSSFPQTVSCRAQDDKFTGEVCVSLLNSKPQGSEMAWILGPFIPVLIDLQAPCARYAITALRGVIKILVVLLGVYVFFSVIQYEP